MTRKRTWLVAVTVSLLSLAGSLLLVRTKREATDGERASALPPASIPRLEWQRQLASQPSTLAQGVRGRVLDRRARPIRHVAVWLAPSDASGLQPPGSGNGEPGAGIGVAETDEQGFFAVGVAAADAYLDLWVLAEGLADHRVPRVHLPAGEWRDLGTLRLEDGLVVEGSVVEARTKRPITGAEVSLIARSEELGFVFFPGRENGICARTDSSGHYRITSAPLAAVRIVAVCPGFVRAEKAGVHLTAGTSNRHDFELIDGGAEISGTVVDRSGQPIIAAQIVAAEADAKDPRTVSVRSSWDGCFRMQGLAVGAYRLTVRHERFAVKEMERLGAGTRDLRIQMQRLGSAAVFVSDVSGHVLTEYEVFVRTELSGKQEHGHTDLPYRKIRTLPGEHGLIEGLMPAKSRYSLQVLAPGYAHAFSEPFEVGLDQEAVPVWVRLDEGGRIEGIVLGKDGAPLVGAQVGTLPRDVPDMAQAAFAMGRLPSDVTRKAVVTAVDGRFEISLLHPGAYWLRVMHKEHCTLVVGGFEVFGGVTRTVPPIRLQQGTLLSGVVRVDGAPAGLVRVIVCTKPTEPRACYGEATSAGDGSFTVRKRFPAGHYVVRAEPLAPVPGEAARGKPCAQQEIDIDGSLASERIELDISTEIVSSR